MRFFLLVLAGSVLAGCAQFCEFGKTSDSEGLKCIRVFSQAEIGMTQKQVTRHIGTPQQRRFDVRYQDKIYEEVWVYLTVPPTVLYFKGGVLEHKEYQQ